ncbi:MAG: type I secretion system permease/ATPase [Xanthobacteraceae bacterium]|nr:type I secretion system permease/ATPase [Xanthobacteraceae bacterium]
MSNAAPRFSPVPARSELAAALESCRGAFVSVGLFSGMSNVLMLTGAFFMLEIYDRVLPSHSVPTLIGISVLAGVLFSFLGLLDMIRGRLLVRIGAALDETLSGRVYDTIVQLPLKAGNRNDGLQPLRDLDSVRSFLSGLGPIALFDLPWMPIYLVICFMLHFWIGVTALGGAIVLIALTVMTERLTQGPTKAATGFAMSRTAIAETSRRNAEVLLAMGMVGPMRARWNEANRKYLASQQLASDVAGGFGSFSKVLRMMLQSGVLAVGAYLAINQQATGGIIIAGAILAARALAPVDLAIANWRGFVAARQSWQRLTRLLELLPVREQPMALQAPGKSLVVENASAAPPGDNKIVVQDVNLKLESGNGLGIIGPSGSGKSSLARMLVGVWQPVRGKIRLDGAALEQWTPETLGRHIGYLPQDVELLTGTVAQNIARFEPGADPEAVIAAAKAAGVHDLIVNLREGYDTQIGEQGGALSAGQAQRIALARALFGVPFLVVLDEPNSNLDAEGDAALTNAILGVRKRGGIVVVIAHRPSAIAGIDHLLMMNKGRTQALGPKNEILSKVLQRDVPAARSLKVVPEAGGSKP